MSGRKRTKRAGARQRTVRIDYGTPELRAKRLALVGAAGDATKAIHPLGAMLARRMIDEEQYNAGCRYGWLYTKALGRGLPTAEREGAANAGLGCCGKVPACADCTPAKIEAKWKQAAAALARANRSTKDAVENVCVYWRWPRWFLVEAGRIIPQRPSDAAEKAALLRGLDALAAIGCVMRPEEGA